MPKFKVTGENIIIEADSVEKIGEMIIPPDGTLLRKKDDYRQWWMQDKKRRWITMVEVLNKMEKDLGFTQADLLLIEPGWEYDPTTLEDIPEGKPIEDWPEDEPEPENPYSWVRGLLTLNPKPPQSLVKALGFNLILLYAHKHPMHWQEWTKGGGLLIPCKAEAWQDESSLTAYVLSDEPDCRHKGYIPEWSPDAELKKYRNLKEVTQKPVGTILCGDIGCGYGKENEWVRVINQMDFVALDLYPYRDDWPDPVAQMQRCHNWWREHVTVPIIPIIQAHWGILHLTRPNPMEQVKFYVDRGYGYVVYPWKDERNGAIDMQNEWYKANQYKKEV